MDKKMKQTKAAKAKAEEEALNRILCWIAGGSVLEFLLLLLNRYYFYYRVEEFAIFTALGVAVKILAVAGLVCACAAAFWWNGAKKAGKGAGLPCVLCLFMVGVSVSCFAAWFFYGTGIHIMYIAVPVVVALAVIYYLYQKEFFLIALESALAMLVIAVCSRALGGQYAALGYVGAIGSALLVLAAAVLCRKAQTGSGCVESGEKTLRLFPKDANYALLYLGAAITLLVIILAAVGINQMVLYAVAVAWLLIAAVYYTVKLM